MKSVTKTSIARFGEHLRKGAEHLHLACKIYADAVIHDQTAVYEFQKAFPYVTDSTWDKMRLVGNGAIEAKILLLSDRLGKKLMRLPIDKQRELMVEDIEIIKDSGKKIVKKKINELNKKEIKQVFKPNMKKRTVAEQIQERTNKATPKVAPYNITGKTLEVHRACILSLKELRQIVRKMS